MLHFLDVLIGFAVVMLAGSMAVTMLTQAANSLFVQRGKALLGGVAQLVCRTLPGLTDDVAQKVARAALTHPSIAEVSGRLPTAVNRDELVRAVLELAAGNVGELDDATRGALRDALAKAGLSDPAAALRDVRSLVLHLEATAPDVAMSVRHRVALAHAAASDFVAQTQLWFDATMDRVSATFTRRVRVITFVLSAVVALALQLDAIGLFNRLSIDETTRKALLENASQVTQEFESVQSGTGATPGAAAAQVAELQRYAAQTVLPSMSRWREEWAWSKLPGILLATLLLTLGAPFWFDSLKNLLRLRPALAQVADAHRAQREAGCDDAKLDVSNWKPPSTATP